jgi:hypothetical protein
MNFRCSKSVAALALWLGGVGCALWTPAAGAGEAIEFSAPAVPLAVPQPLVEIKEPGKMIGSADASDGVMDGAEMTPPTQIIIRRQKKNDPWEATSLRGDNPDRHDFDDPFGVQPKPNRLTNNSSLNMQHGWEASDSSSLLGQRDDSLLGAGQKASKFGALNSSDKDSGRETDRLGRGFSDEKDEPLLSKIFGHNLTAADRYGGGWVSPVIDEASPLTDGTPVNRLNNPETASTRLETLPSGFGHYAPQVDIQDRQTDQQAWATQGYPQLQDTSPARSMPSKSYTDREESRAPRFAAPNLPTTLAAPKHPGDPF